MKMCSSGGEKCAGSNPSLLSRGKFSQLDSTPSPVYGTQCASFSLSESCGKSTHQQKNASESVHSTAVAEMFSFIHEITSHSIRGASSSTLCGMVEAHFSSTSLHLLHLSKLRKKKKRKISDERKRCDERSPQACKKRRKNSNLMKN